MTVDGQENVIGTQITGDAGSLMIWESDSSCQGGYLNPGASDTEFGFIGPFTKTSSRGWTCMPPGRHPMTTRTRPLRCFTSSSRRGWR